MDISCFDKKLAHVISKDTPINNVPLESVLAVIPRIDQLTDVPEGYIVLIRSDLDTPIANNEVQDLSRLESIIKTVEYSLSRNWTIILFGHIGRDKNNTLKPVCGAFSTLLKKEIQFIADWIDEQTYCLKQEAIDRIRSAKPGSIFMLENTRKYQIECALWKADKDTFQDISKRMYKLSEDIITKLSDVEINEAIAASNLDYSSCSLPLLMKKTGLGFFIDSEMKTHIKKVREAKRVVFSGLKIDKLDDLQGIIDRGHLRKIVSAGSLAMALKKAAAQLMGKDFCIGLAESDKTKKYFIDKKRIEQAKDIIHKCREKAVELILPVDFILDNGLVSKEIPPDRAQMDIGPETIRLFQKVLQNYIDESKSSAQQFVFFYNGVFGKFEDPRYENGTREFIGMLRELTHAGVATYAGGGEGRLALMKYGTLGDVTHSFTSGGTVLKSLTNNHIGYLKSLYLQNYADPNVLG
ncbi:MAG: phosphoglycerate kinase [Syntrophales bacterium]